MKNNFKKTTIHDVARVAGKSIAAVSLALSGNRRISEDTRLRVLAVAKQLNYTPDRIAQSLTSGGRSRIIGVIYPNGFNPVYWEMNMHLAQAALKNNFEITPFFTNYDPEKERMFLNLMHDKWLAGLIVFPDFAEPGSEFYRQLANSKIPVVIRGQIDWLPNLTQVTLDVVRGGYLATKHLVAHGHKKILYLKSSYGLDVHGGRIDGYRRALAEAGIAPDESLVVSCAPGTEDAYGVMRKLLEDDKKFTAVFAHCDNLAFGVMRAILDMGYKIPDDFAVVGFDDVLLAQYASVPLTTIGYSKEELAAKLVEGLLVEMKNGEKTGRLTVLEPELVERLSSGKRCASFSEKPARDVRAGAE